MPSQAGTVYDKDMWKGAGSWRGGVGTATAMEASPQSETESDTLPFPL